MANRRNIFITGATDGLGFALAKRYAAQGERPFLLGRKPLSALDDPLFAEDRYCQVDLNELDAAAQIGRFLQEQRVRHIDLLIHNAATGYFGELAEQPSENIDLLLQVNLFTPIKMSHKLLPLVEAAEGQIVFISSVVSALPAADYAVYGATKAALDGFARSLRLEYPSVTVQVVAPGATRTGLHDKIGIDKATMNWDRFPPAEKVAQQIEKAIDRKRPYAVIGLPNKLLRLAGWRFPRLVERLMRQGAVPSAPRAESHQPLCVITGAAEGIGKALAYRFGRAGYRIVGIDVNGEEAMHTLTELEMANISASFIVANLMTDEGLQEVRAGLQDCAAIDVLIHNAGISAVGRFDDQAYAPQQAVLDVNLRAPLRITADLLSTGCLRSAGSIIFISSLSHFVSYPGAAVYAASKDGLTAFARSVRVAFGGDPHVMTVFPGPTRTAHARRYSPDNSREETRMSPDILANAILEAVQNRQEILIPSASLRLMAFFGRWLPSLAEKAMVRAILDKLDVRNSTEPSSTTVKGQDNREG